VNREPDNGVHHILGCGVDRHLIAELGKEQRQFFDSACGNEHGARLAYPAASKDPEHDLPFGNETTVATGDIALTNLTIRRDTRIVRVIDGSDLPQVFDFRRQPSAAWRPASQARPWSVTATLGRPSSPRWRAMRRRSTASSQTVSRGHDVRQASITSSYGLARGASQAKKSKIRASIGSDIGGLR
jgi:hypothetical protein